MICRIVVISLLLSFIRIISCSTVFAIEQDSTCDPKVYQAEEAQRFGQVRVAKNIPGFTENGYLECFERAGDQCEFIFEAPESGFYDLVFVTASIGGYKENYVLLDGERLGVVITDSISFNDSVFYNVYMDQGKHRIGFSTYWGYVLLDALIINPSDAIDESIYHVTAALVNPCATDQAKRLMNYLVDSYGKVILSGQFCDKGILAQECGVIFLATGKRPAVLGLDMMDYTPSRVARGTNCKAIEYAIQCDELGGIVTFCWHWNAPEPYLKPGGIWYRGFYTEETSLNLTKIINGEDTIGYHLLLDDIDAIAIQLLRLQDAGVPVLWRPLHEASGGWFWWGAHGADSYKSLWILLYDRLVTHWQLNNLIWIWNGQNAAWYPGDSYVDIIGEDIYAGERVYSSQINRFLNATQYTNDRKMIVLSENGCLIDPDLAVRDGAMWGLFTTWGGEFVIKSNILKLSEKYTDTSMVEKVYHHERVITLDELPNLKNYPIRNEH